MDKSNYCRICGGLKSVTLSNNDDSCTAACTASQYREILDNLGKDYKISEIYCGTCGIMYHARSV